MFEYHTFLNTVNKYFNKLTIKFTFAIRSEAQGNNLMKYFMYKYKVRN